MAHMNGILKQNTDLFYTSLAILNVRKDTRVVNYL